MLPVLPQTHAAVFVKPLVCISFVPLSGVGVHGASGFWCRARGKTPEGSRRQVQQEGPGVGIGTWSLSVAVCPAGPT